MYVLARNQILRRARLAPANTHNDVAAAAALRACFAIQECALAGAGIADVFAGTRRAGLGIVAGIEVVFGMNAHDGPRC